MNAINMQLHVHQPHRQLRGASRFARPDAGTHSCLSQTKKLQPEAQTSCKMEDIYLVCHLPGVWAGEGQAAAAGEPFSGPVIYLTASPGPAARATCAGDAWAEKEPSRAGMISTAQTPHYHLGGGPDMYPDGSCARALETLQRTKASSFPQLHLHWMPKMTYRRWCEHTAAAAAHTQCFALGGRTLPAPILL